MSPTANENYLGALAMAEWAARLTGTFAGATVRRLPGFHPSTLKRLIEERLVEFDHNQPWDTYYRISESGWSKLRGIYPDDLQLRLGRK